MQTLNETRTIAMQAVLNRKPVVMNEKNINFKDVYALNVLTYKKLKEVLSESNYNELIKSTSFG